MLFLGFALSLYACLELAAMVATYRSHRRSVATRGSTNSSQQFRLAHIYAQSFPDLRSQVASNEGGAADFGALRVEAQSQGYAYPFILQRWSASSSGEEAADSESKAEDDRYRLSIRHLDIEHHQQLMQGLAQHDSLRSYGRKQPQGTGRMLRDMRGRYLASRSGTRRSYWAFTGRHQSAVGDGNNLIVAADGSDGGSDGISDDARRGQWNYTIEDGLLIPDVSDRYTVTSLARMAANAYQGGPEGEWEDLGNFWDTKHSFGWRRDGIRGHVFASEDNSTIVISFKGTSAALFLGGGTETSVNDKFNDNRLFSCCCARVDFSWSPVCDCYMGNNMCNATCIDNSLNDDPDIYFHAAANIFMDVTRAYPDSHIVLVGHSLGGSIASLLGLTFGVPVVAYEAPGEALAARRLHLPVPTDSALMGVLPTWHIGHTADPIYMGVCTGPTSSCYYAGYAMESSCHLGQQCVFDTVRLKDWRLDIRHHRINEVIYLMLEPWGLTNLDEKWPKCLAESDECEDCGLWSFVNGDDDGDSNHNGGDDGGGESLNSDTP